MTTKIITFLIGNPYKPSFTTVTVRGPHPRFIYDHMAVSKNRGGKLPKMDGENIGKPY